MCRWLNKLVAELGLHPSRVELKKYVEDTLAKGQVVPGYGHGVLRKTDPRYTCQVGRKERGRMGSSSSPMHDVAHAFAS